MNEIVDRIDALRHSKGMTQKDLAKAIGISKSAVYKWGKSSSLPSLENIENVCKVFGITVEQFFNGMGTVDNKPEQEFLDAWRMLTDLEKSAIERVLMAFKDDKAVHND